MSQNIPRRTFLAAGAASLAAVAARADKTIEAKSKTPNGFMKATKYYMVKPGKTLVEKFQLLKDLGFDGIELDAPRHDPKEVLAAKEATGLKVPGLVGSAHWSQPVSDPSAAVRAKGLEALKKGLHEAKQYGASTILFVPAVVNKKTSYADAYKRSQEEIRKAIPLAKELGVKIAIENVWNNFLLSPLEMAKYIDEFESDRVGVHFDVGNIVVYGWPEQWIRTLGKRILKLDIKEFSRAKADKEGRYKGFDVPLLKGDCDWPAVMKALRDIEYVGWGAAEIAAGDKEYLAGVARDMDTIFGY